MPVPCYGSLIGLSQTLNGATGRIYALGNSLNPVGSILISAYLKLTTTATAGNRLPLLQILDPAGNVIWYSSVGSFAASTFYNIVWGAGVQGGAGMNGNGGFNSLPVEMPIPPNARLQLSDVAGVDVNDTINIFNAVYKF